MRRNEKKKRNERCAGMGIGRGSADFRWKKQMSAKKNKTSAEKKFRKKMQGCFMQFLHLIFVKKLQLQGALSPGPPLGALPPGPPLEPFCGPQAPTFQLTFPFLIPMPGCG